jgi:hypothetical protein
VELLAKFCYQEYEIFVRQVMEFYGKLQGGDIWADKTTVRKKRNTGERGNTTTAKRKRITNI